MVRTDEGIVCYCAGRPVFTNIDDAIEHLLEHCIAGDKAPYGQAIEMLREMNDEMMNEKTAPEKNVFHSMDKFEKHYFPNDGATCSNCDY